MYTYKENEIPEISQLAHLYHEVGWYNYTKDLKRLERCFQKSV